MHLEEKLYIAELLIPHIDFFGAHSYVKTIDILTNFDDEGEEVAPFGNLKYTDHPSRI